MITRYMKKGLAGNQDQYSIKSYMDGQAAMKMQASSLKFPIADIGSPYRTSPHNKKPVLGALD